VKKESPCSSAVPDHSYLQSQFMAGTTKQKTAFMPRICHGWGLEEPTSKMGLFLLQIQ